jgi:hypothetical protein
LQDIVERTSNDVKMLVKHFQMVQTQIDQLTKVQKDLLVNASIEKHACEISTRSGASTQDPLYPEGHPKRIEQDSQRAAGDGIPSRKKRRSIKQLQNLLKQVKILIVFLFLMLKPKVVMLLIKKKLRRNQKISLRMQSTPSKISLPINMVVREPWVQKSMPFPGMKHKSKEEEHYNRFCKWMKPLFLQIPLTDAIKMTPYSKYMKDIDTNKRTIPSEEISTLLANYSFDGKVPEKLGDPGIPTIPCSIKNNYVRTALCDLGARVSVMPFSLYKRLDLEKLISTDIS